VTRIDVLRPEFVKYVPEVLEPGVLYISTEYETAVHLCCCGWCNIKTVTPFGSWSESWTLTVGDQGVTLSPSIGNFQMPCKSHYFIEANQVRWV
jgi:hypothetical protein